MTLADKVTSTRLILAPFFFVLFLLPAWFPATAGWVWTLPVLWVIFVFSELTDMFDGQIARSRKEVSDFGKLFDPFADTLMRITYFLAFVMAGILPSILLLVVIFREFSQSFLRTLMMQRGVAMGARSGGKIKAVAYMITEGFALLATTVQRLGLPELWYLVVRWIAVGCFGIAVILALTSFLDYITLFKKTPDKE